MTYICLCIYMCVWGGVTLIQKVTMQHIFVTKSKVCNQHDFQVISFHILIMHLCASMQNHLIKNYNASENLCLCLSPGSMRCLRTERDQRKDNSGRATESCAAYSTHCNICQEIFFGPHHSSPLWVNTSVPILMNHK